MKTITLASALGLLVALSPNAASAQHSFSFSTWFDGPMVDRPHAYDIAASAMLEGSTWRMWTCGLQTINSVGVDAIFYTTNPPGPSSTTVALSPTFNDTAPDGYLACSPSVVKHEWPTYEPFYTTKYFMYYECAPRFYPLCLKHTDQGDVLITHCQDPVACNPMYLPGPSEICAARSTDGGATWLKYNDTYGFTSSHEPTPIIRATTQRNSCWMIPQDCDGPKTWSLFQTHDTPGGLCGTPPNNGVGHPSTVVMRYGPNGQTGQMIWLYYFDSAGPEGAGVYLKKSWDGMHFFGKPETDAPWKAIGAEGAPDVTFRANNGLNDLDGGLFIATVSGIPQQSSNQVAHFYTSTDGINWTAKQPLAGAVAQDGRCALGAAPLTNSFGQVSGTFMTFLSSEAKFGQSDKPTQNRPGEPLQLTSCDTGNEGSPSCLCYSWDEVLPAFGGTGGRGHTWGVWSFQGYLQ